MMTIQLIGKNYIDTIISCNNVVEGETNQIKSIVGPQRGGMLKLPHIKGINYQYSFTNTQKAFIIADLQSSIRTSFTIKHDDLRVDTPQPRDVADWVHLMYVDDLDSKHLHNLETLPVPHLSIDFCTVKPRARYTPLLDKCTLIFDSRERKDLWRSIKTKAPLILHDGYGCECTRSGKPPLLQKNHFVKNLNVNGAGDIFAIYFIKSFLKKGLQAALKKSCKKTTQKLLYLNNSTHEN